MITYINIAILVITTLLFLVTYIYGTSPYQLQKKIGTKAFTICNKCRLWSVFFFNLAKANYIIYFFFPLTYINDTLSYHYYILLCTTGICLIALTAYLLLEGFKETKHGSFINRKETNLYQGIYTKIRHPQLVGQMLFFLGLALVINSIFLLIYAFIFTAIFILCANIEEKDLIKRHGDLYKNYIKKTGKFFPKIIPN